MSLFNRKQFLKTILGAGALPFLNPSFLNDTQEQLAQNSAIESLSDIETEEEWIKIRKQFPLKDSHNYFNTSGLGSCPNPVLDMVCQSLRLAEENSTNNRKSLIELRTKLGVFLGADPDDLAFVRNTTEGLNIIARELVFEEGDEIITTSHEHIGGASPLIMLEKEKGIKVNIVELDLSGEKNLELIQSQINSNTKLVCVSHVTCTTGMILPIKKLSEFCKSKKVMLCVDGAQAAGLIPLNLKDLDVDFYASSGHKWLFGPKGTGFLYVNKRAFPKLKPLFSGAYSDKSFNFKKHELEFRSSISRVEYGTKNIPVIKGLLEAVRFHNQLGFEKELKRNKDLADHFKKEVSLIKGIKVLSPISSQFSTSIVTFSLEGIDYIDLRNLLFSDYKHRLRGIYENDLNALRLCVAIYNNKNQVNQILKDIQKISDSL